MRSSNKIKSIVFNLCTLIGIWIIYLISSLILKSQKSDLLKYIPSNYEYYGVLNNSLLNKKIANQLLLESPNDSLYLQFSELVKEINTDPSKQTGINLMSNIVFFKTSINNSPIICFLFELNDPVKFRKQQLYESTFLTSNDEIGLVLFPMRKESKLKLDEIAKNIFDNNNNDLTSKLNKNELASIQFKNSKNQLKVIEQKNGITITGCLENTSIIKEQEVTANNPSKSFHLSANYIPDFIANYIQQKLNQQLYNTPLIKSFSINYQGIEIKEDEDDEFLILPKCNAHIVLDSSISQKRILKIFGPITTLTIDSLTNSFRIGSELYSYKLNKNHLHIGKSSKELQTNDSENLFHLSGNISSLFSIKGPSFITGFIEMLPPYFISKKYANSIQSIYLKVKKNKKKTQLLIDFSLKMKPSKNMYHETLKMFLDFQSSGL